MGNSAPTTIPTTEKPQAVELLKDFLDKNNIELRLTPPNIRAMQDGGLLLDPPQIVAQYKVIPTKDAVK